MQRVIWEDRAVDAAVTAELAAALQIPPVIAHLLVQRGLTTPEAAHAFLNPSLSQLHDPFLLAGMHDAVERLLAAIARKEHIAIHGDYDVDGITSTVMLRRALELLGADVSHFVPERIRDGYGLQPATIERLHAAGANVIVSVDCGIRASEAAARARELGVDLIITDHHEPEATLPPALAVINPKRHDCAYPDKHLAGVGVALKVVQGLLQRAGRSVDSMPHFVKVAAIGTLADVVPLIGENRVIAREGLAGLSAGPNSAGLEALIEASGLTGRKLDSFHVSFMLAPRINAAGRMASPELAAELLLLRGRDETTRARARVLAQQLADENTRRQEQEAAIVTQAKRSVEKDPAVGAHNVLVVSGDGWHRGVIGIVASKLVDSFYKPAIVLSIEDGIAHGSCRSIPAFDMLAALESMPELFIKFGGHKQAAGVTLEAERVPELRRRMAEIGATALTHDDLRPRLRIDAPLSLRDISGPVIEGLTRMGPFGAANSKPVFRASPVELLDRPKVLKERHLALMVRQDGRAFRAMAWRAAEREEYLLANRTGLELAYSLEQNEFRGETRTELTVADLRLPIDV
ncbi:MAG: single-stranded-DNA-specific exonuclease RecJ [Acidobacteria bacterium]|nr:MAG: single-stranded-DNA-specific exonuclease RecJ [Acidobacteriota bacterium]